MCWAPNKFRKRRPVGVAADPLPGARVGSTPVRPSRFNRLPKNHERSATASGPIPRWARWSPSAAACQMDTLSMTTALAKGAKVPNPSAAAMGKQGSFYEPTVPHPCGTRLQFLTRSLRPPWRRFMPFQDFDGWIEVGQPPFPLGPCGLPPTNQEQQARRGSGRRLEKRQWCPEFNHQPWALPESRSAASKNPGYGSECPPPRALEA